MNFYSLSRGLDSVAIRQPLGVCAGIVPFNFPAALALWMMPVAIAAGICIFKKCLSSFYFVLVAIVQICAQSLA